MSYIWGARKYLGQAYGSCPLTFLIDRIIFRSRNVHADGQGPKVIDVIGNLHLLHFPCI